MWKKRNSFFETERQAIANLEEGDVDSLVVLQLFVELPESHRVRSLVSGVDHSPIPERVVEGDDSSRTQQDEAQFVVSIVTGLVGVDEGVVEGAGFSAVDELLQRLGSRSDVQTDLVRDAGFLPERLAWNIGSLGMASWGRGCTGYCEIFRGISCVLWLCKCGNAWISA